MRKVFLTSLLSLALASLASEVSAVVITFTDRTAFLNALVPGYFEDTFSDVTNGGIFGNVSVRSGNGFAVSYSAPSYGLYSVTGGMSTNVSTNDLIARFTGDLVYAAGGYFYLSDINGDYQSFPGNGVSAFADNGIDPVSMLVASENSPTNFFGWVSSEPLLSITMNSGGTSPDRWNTLDDFIVGAAVPEIGPAGMGSVLALVTGVLGLLERRRPKGA